MGCDNCTCGDGPRLIKNPSPTLIHNLYLSAPHSDHLDPKYFPWCSECHTDDAA